MPGSLLLDKPLEASLSELNYISRILEKLKDTLKKLIVEEKQKEYQECQENVCDFLDHAYNP